jgi:ABC-type glycerol-3-phosphate transport system substrate-binding protein
MMTKGSRALVAALLLGSALLAPAAPSSAAAQSEASAPVGPPDGTASYDELVALFAEFNAWKDPKPVDGVVDYSPVVVEQRGKG